MCVYDITIFLFAQSATSEFSLPAAYEFSYRLDNTPFTSIFFLSRTFA